MPFPTYYTVTQCWQDEVRVVYNLYYQKDGWSDTVIAKGHMHDWERVSLPGEDVRWEVRWWETY